MRTAENKINGAEAPGLAAYRECEAQRSSLHRRVAQMQEKIDEQVRIGQEVLGRIPAVDSFDAEFEDLAASELLGKIKPADLATRREDIAKRRAAAQKAAVSVQQEVAAVRSGLGGLRRLMEQARSDLQKLEEHTDDLRDAAIVEQAEAIGAEYLAAAQKVWGTYLQLEALRNELDRSALNFRGRNKRDFGGRFTYDLRLPAFNLKVFEGSAHPGYAAGWELAGGYAAMGPAVAAAGEVERARLRALGIQA